MGNKNTFWKFVINHPHKSILEEIEKSWIWNVGDSVNKTLLN